MTFLDTVRLYTENGWNIFPLHRPQGTACSCAEACGKAGKHPRIKDWQQAICDPPSVEEWWRQWPESNIGLRLDDLVVLDVDGSEGAASLAALEAEHGPLNLYARQRSGSGGWHYLFDGAAPAGKRIKFKPGLDLLTGGGSYIVVAPSLHASGGQYRWVDSGSPLLFRRDEMPLTPPPEWLLQAASAVGHKQKTPPAERVPVEHILAKAVGMIGAGTGRNDAGMWFFCQLRDNGYSRDEATLWLRKWANKANTAAPGDDRYRIAEAQASIRQVYKREAREPWSAKEGKNSQVDELLRLAEEDFEYFKSGPMDDPYVRITINGHREVWKAERVKEVITQRFLGRHGKAPSRDALNTFTDTVIAKCGSAPSAYVYVRFARSRDAIYLDLCDEAWRAVEITPDSWHVVERPPVLFRRAAGARPLPVPSKGGTLEALRPLLNCDDDAQWSLMVGWLLGAFLPDGAFPHLVLEGEQGSAKSTTARVLHSLLDPSEAGLSSPPKDETDATISALDAGILAYDNLSGCRSEIADTLCRFSTGQGYKTRTFYKNLGLTVASVKLPVLLNGIDSTIMRGDLLERCITLRLPRITPEHRRTEQFIWNEFEAVHPFVLGALLDVVSTGLRNLPSTTLKNAPRMSDFATWVTACEPALPWEPGTFIATYTQRLKDANCDLINNDAVAAAIVQWVNSTLLPGSSDLSLSCKDLLIELNSLMGYTPKDLKFWPQSPEALGHKLPRLAPALRSHGIDMRKLKPSRDARSRWQISRVGAQIPLVLKEIEDDGLTEAA